MAIIIIFIFSFFVRIYRLDFFPLNTDEPMTFFLPNNFDTFLGIPVACCKGAMQPFLGYLVFFTRKIFSSPEFVVRVPAVIIGSATVILIYLLAKEMYGRKAGLVSALLLAFLPWHVIQSRIGVSLIFTPFFSCLIFLSLLKAIHKQNDFYFLLSCFLLGIGAFYTYHNSVILIPIFILILAILRKDLYWLKPKTVLLGTFIFLVVIYPLIYLQLSGEINLLDKFYRPYHQSPFQGNILLNLFTNLRKNAPRAFETLFFNSQGRILFANALKSPLLISKITLSIVIFSIIISFWQRSVSDKIILVWLALGLLGSLSGINYFMPHYCIIVMPVFLILLSRFITTISNCSRNNILFKRRLFFLEIFFCAGLVFTEISQFMHYYKDAPQHFEEDSLNSYGCKEAAYYLSKIPNIKDYRIFFHDENWATLVYLKSFIEIDFRDLLKMKEGNQRKKFFYVLLASESDPQEIPVKIIYYSNGLPAIYIFKVEADLTEKAK